MTLSSNVGWAIKGLQLLVEAHPHLEHRDHLLVLSMTLVVTVKGQAVLEGILKRVLHPPLLVGSLQSYVFVPHDSLQPQLWLAEFAWWLP